jgi:hypothetical protein
MLDRTVRCLAALTLLASAGCASTFADPTGRLTALETAQRRYTQLVRWGEIRRASEYVEPDLREEFMSYEPFFEQIRFTDTEAEDVALDPSEDTASVAVTYHAYSLATFQEKQIQEKQEWTRHDGILNNWLVRPQIEEIVAAFRVESN